MAASDGPYYRGDFKISLNFFSLDANLKAWITGSNDAPAVDTLDAIRYAHEAGFDAVDVTAYYIPGYDERQVPTLAQDQIVTYAKQIRVLSDQLNLTISGTGIRNDFVDPDSALRHTHVERAKYWIHIAQALGAPVIRVFSGAIPKDIAQHGWEGIVRSRLVPALQELAAFGSDLGVQIGLQNHADMMSTADQIVQTVALVDHPNLGIINDTGCFRPFQGSPEGYDWYQDIATALPSTINFQLKESPCGVGSDVPIDLERFFRILRRSAYRGPIPIELLWTREHPRSPSRRPDAPYDDISRFLASVRSAMRSTASA